MERGEEKSVLKDNTNKINGFQAIKLLKYTPETGAINSVPDFGAYVILSGIKFLLMPVSGVEKNTALFLCQKPA